MYMTIDYQKWCVVWNYCTGACMWFIIDRESPRSDVVTSFISGVFSSGCTYFICSISCFLNRDTADPKLNIVSTVVHPTSPFITVVLLLIVATVSNHGITVVRDNSYPLQPHSGCFPVYSFSIHDLAYYR